MLIHVGCDIKFVFPQPTAVILMLSLHPLRGPTIRRHEHLHVTPSVPISYFFDTNGNRCGRVFVPAGHFSFCNEAIVEDCGLPDLQAINAPQGNIQDLPQEVLQFLLASRYCEVDSELKAIAWSLFSHTHAGLAARPGGVRFRSPAYSFRLPAGPGQSHCAGGLSRAEPVCAAITCTWRSLSAAA